MIIYQEPAGEESAKHADRERGSVRQPISRNASTPEQQGPDVEESNAARPSRRRSQPRQAPGRLGGYAHVTVLIVDDEESVRETLVEVLSFAGYRTITAASVAEAEEAKERLGIEDIDLVISDIHLTPGRQIRAGYVLAQRWQSDRPALPVILISGDSSNQDLPDVRAGAMRFLLKPFRMEVLLDTVQEALGR